MSKEINLEGYRLAHTMIRVKDLEASFNFYCKTLGMKVLRKTDYPEGKFTNAFIGYGIEITKTVAIEIGSNQHNALYLKTKRDKMGHSLKNLDA